MPEIANLVSGRARILFSVAVLGSLPSASQWPHQSRPSSHREELTALLFHPLVNTGISKGVSSKKLREALMAAFSNLINTPTLTYTTIEHQNELYTCDIAERETKAQMAVS